MSEPLVKVTELARGKILGLLQQEGPGSALRFGVAGRGPGGFQYRLGFVSGSDLAHTDSVVDAGDGLPLVVGEKSPQLVRAPPIAFVARPHGAGLPDRHA